MWGACFYKKRRLDVKTFFLTICKIFLKDVKLWISRNERRRAKALPSRNIAGSAKGAFSGEPGAAPQDL